MTRFLAETCAPKVQKSCKSLRCDRALADARATDMSLGLFRSPTVREGLGL